MNERPILFSGAMVRALLAGTKTQTRRVVRTENTMGLVSILAPRHGKKHAPVYLLPDHEAEVAACCPYGQPGDRLWVREAWFDAESALHSCVLYRASDDHPGNDVKWRPSIHMPRWASRITLEITGVRVERLQDITRGDAMSEGCPFPNMAKGEDPCKWYADLWNQINGPAAWDANPWVWVVEFRKLP